jgi:hypothetical protein
MFQPFLRRLRLRHKTSAWTSGVPVGGRRLAGYEQLGRYTVEPINFCRLYLYSGKLTLGAKYLRRVRVSGLTRKLARLSSSHDYAHPYNPALHTGQFIRTPALLKTFSSYRPVRAFVGKCSKCYQRFRSFCGHALFVREMVHAYFQWAR